MILIFIEELCITIREVSEIEADFLVYDLITYGTKLVMHSQHVCLGTLYMTRFTQMDLDQHFLITAPLPVELDSDRFKIKN